MAGCGGGSAGAVVHPCSYDTCEVGLPEFAGEGEAAGVLWAGDRGGTGERAAGDLGVDGAHEDVAVEDVEGEPGVLHRKLVEAEFAGGGGGGVDALAKAGAGPIHEAGGDDLGGIGEDERLDGARAFGTEEARSFLERERGAEVEGDPAGLVGVGIVVTGEAACGGERAAAGVEREDVVVLGADEEGGAEAVEGDAAQLDGGDVGPAVDDGEFGRAPAAEHVDVGVGRALAELEVVPEAGPPLAEPGVDGGGEEVAVRRKTVVLGFQIHAVAAAHGGIAAVEDERLDEEFARSMATSASVRRSSVP
jgi:hypothetical protein